MTSAPRVLSSQPGGEGWPPISEEEVELPSGARKRWIRMHLGTSAAVLATTPQKQIILTREYRHGLGRIVHSLPGGTARNGESAEACARRELMEETGYQAPKFLEMYAGNNLTAYLEGTLHLYFAKDCQATERRPDPDEIQAVERMSVTQALSRTATAASLRSCLGSSSGMWESSSSGSRDRCLRSRSPTRRGRSALRSCSAAGPRTSTTPWRKVAKRGGTRGK